MGFTCDQEKNKTNGKKSNGIISESGMYPAVIVIPILIFFALKVVFWKGLLFKTHFLFFQSLEVGLNIFGAN